MAKIKNKAKKKQLSEKVTQKETQKKKALNPFEVRVNRRKHNVLGQKSKSDRGLPGISRSKAIVKRKRTLLQEYNIKDKANTFFDRRIGEKNNAMTAEDRIMARFTAERMKFHNKKSIFNLADDEILTHHGQTLTEIEKFDDPRSDDDDEEEKGALSADFVEGAHFGGGILRKTSEDGSLSRKDLIDQLIAESKKRKAEKQRTREQTIELTQKLDADWQDLIPIVSATNRAVEEVNRKPDSYDMVMRELKFEARGKPSDRLKSEEELARDEKERLEKLEAERLQRMHGLKENVGSQRKHRSADDLDDGLEIESDIGEEEMITYDADGKLLSMPSEEKQESGAISGNIIATNDSEEEREAEKSNASGDEQTDDESGDSTDDGDDEVNNDYVDDLADLKHVSDSESSADSDNEGKEEDDKSSIPLQFSVKPSDENKLTAKADEIREDLQARKELMEAARKELPYTFQIPDTYEDLQSLFADRSADHQAVILERIMKCNHPSLGEGYKDKLSGLFAFLLQHLQDIAISASWEAEPSDIVDDKTVNCFIVLDRIFPQLYDLAHVQPVKSAEYVSEVLREKQQDYRARSSFFPQLDTLVFLKLISNLFPTSDFRHPVVTPTLVFMCQVLHQSKVRTGRDVAVGLFLVTLLLEFTVLSRRFPPAAVNFLTAVVDMAVEKKCLRLVSVVHPAHVIGRARNLLVASETSGSSSEVELMNMEDLRGLSPEDDAFKLRSLHTAVKLLLDLCSQLDNLTANFNIFQPVLHAVKQLNTENYPMTLQEDIRNLITRIESMRQKKMRFLVEEKKRPKPLRLYEPRIEKIFDGKKRRPIGKERQEHEKLLHKYKREMKGAIREIRRDKSFLARLKYKQIIKDDMERKQKVREIFGGAANQQGAVRNLQRKRITPLRKSK